MFAACISKRIKGLTLIELLLALSIALMISSALVEIYLTNRQSHQLQTALSSIQENANVVITLLTSEIRKAGNIGCPALTKTLLLEGGHPNTLTYDNAISVQKRELIVRYADFPRAVVTTLSEDLSRLIIHTATSFSEKDIFIISDCTHAELFQAKKIISSPTSSQTLLLTHPLHRAFGPQAEVSRLVIHRYLISRTARKNIDGSLIDALFVIDEHQHKMELVENIQEMHFLKYKKGVEFDFIAQAGPLKKTWYHYVGLKS